MRWVVALWMLVGVAHAQSFHTTSSGGLARSHAQLTCDQCHVNGTRALSNARCAACHAFVQRGLHAEASVQRKVCQACHVEHRGANGDVQGWSSMGGVPQFDHARTTWPLAGAHATVACVRCHATTLPSGRTRFTGLSTTCGACHQPNPHRFAGPEFQRCDRCHGESAWKPVKPALDFDHDAETSLPLVGAHRDVACARCHPKAEYALAKPACEACHASPHGARFAKLPGGCATCHRAVRWRSVTAFGHAEHTRFALTGKHATLACRECHRAVGPSTFEDLGGQTGCKACHAHAKVHADADHPDGRFTTAQCTNCHVPTQMHPPRPAAQIFHGPQSTFPLVGGHEDVPCAECHVERDARGQRRFDRTAPACGERCHEDTAHRGALGATCTQCHVSGVWTALKFEHLAYRLEGEHRDLACVRCHGTSKVFKGAPRRCADPACHAQDDAHGGALGATCDRCHLANGDNRFNHAISAKFKLDGQHLAIACEDCHPTRAFKPRPFTCGGCHPEPRAHFGKYGTFCERCHTTAGWR